MNQRWHIAGQLEMDVDDGRLEKKLGRTPMFTQQRQAARSGEQTQQAGALQVTGLVTDRHAAGA